MKGTILDYSWNEKKHVAYIKKEYPIYGTFEAILKPIDSEEFIFGSLFAYDVVEKKCDLKALKRKVQYVRQRYIAIKQLKDETYFTFQKTQQAGCTLEWIDRKANLALRDYCKIKQEYKDKKEALKKVIEGGIQMQKKIKERQEQLKEKAI